MSGYPHVPVQFTERALQHARKLRHIKRHIARRYLELQGPGVAEQRGIALRGRLSGCRRIHVGNDYRMIYLVRATDVVILAIWLRKDAKAYEEAERALNEPLPPPPEANGAHAHAGQ